MTYDPNRPPYGQPDGQQLPVVSGPPTQGSYPVPPQTRPSHYDEQAPAWPPVQDPQPEGRPKWPWLLLAAAVLFAAGGLYAAYDRNLIFKDFGVQACEAMA